MPEDTKIIYHIGDEQTPYVSKINIPPDVITLGDFKTAIKKPNFKYFFRSTDADFGVVKEEITNDDANLPHDDNNRIVAWLVAPEIDDVSQGSASNTNTLTNSESRRSTGNSREDVYQNGPSKPQRDSDLDSIISSHRGGMNRQQRMYNKFGSQSTLMSSDIETTSWDSRSEISDYSTLSDMTSSTRHKLRQRKRMLKKKRPRPSSDTTSTYSSSITDSSMSLNILTVVLNMEKYNFLGISIVGQTNDKGDGGIYIGSIMKGGAVAADGRVEPGDMLLQVNEVNFENMSNEDAVRVLRNIVHKPGPITLTVAKCWDPNPESSYFTIPKDEPVRPIDPGVWANQIITAPGGYHAPMGCYSNNRETSSETLGSSLPESDRYDMQLSTLTDMGVVVKTLKMADSGLDVKTRMWLKITIPNAFIGSDLVEWLQQKVEGLSERRVARKYASNLLKAGYIRHTVNKITFSEQCYYVFGEYTGTGLLHKDFGTLSLGDSNSDRESDTLGPLPTHSGAASHWAMAPPQAGNINSGGFAPYNPYNNFHPSPQLSVGPRNPSNGMSNPMMDHYGHEPQSYGAMGGMHSDVDTISLHSAQSVLQRGPPSEMSASRQHLATFGAGGSAGSGSDQASEGKYSSHSGGARSGGGSSSGAKRSISGSEKSLEMIQSQNSLNRGGSYGSLQRQYPPAPPQRTKYPAPLPPPPQPHLPPPPNVPGNPHSHYQVPTSQQHHPQTANHHHGSRPPSSQGNPLHPQHPQQLPPRPLSHPGNLQQQQQGRPLNAVPQDLSASRQSFQNAMSNPCDYFVDVM